jgi:hypothetical protein
MDISDSDNLQTDLNRLGQLGVENEMKINPGKNNKVSFTKARLKEGLRYYFKEQLILEQVAIIFRNNYTQRSKPDRSFHTLQKTWKAPHFIIRIFKKGNKITNGLTCTSPVRPILEYGAVCWGRTEKVS